jgi:hypothetical protein
MMDVPHCSKCRAFGHELAECPLNPPTLRQRYTIAALTGLCANPNIISPDKSWSTVVVRNIAIELADAVLAAEQKS